MCARNGRRESALNSRHAATCTFLARTLSVIFPFYSVFCVSSSTSPSSHMTGVQVWPLAYSKYSGFVRILSRVFCR